MCHRVIGVIECLSLVQEIREEIIEIFGSFDLKLIGPNAFVYGIIFIYECKASSVNETYFIFI